MTELTLREAELAIGTDETARAEQLAITALELARAGDAGELECAGTAAARAAAPGARRSTQPSRGSATPSPRPTGTACRCGVSAALHEIGTIALLDRSEVDALLDAQRLAESVGAMATATVLDIEIAAGYAGLDDFDMQRRHGMQAVRRGGELGFGLIVAFGWQHVAGAVGSAATSKAPTPRPQLPVQRRPATATSRGCCSAATCSMPSPTTSSTVPSSWPSRSRTCCEDRRPRRPPTSEPLGRCSSPRRGRDDAAAAVDEIEEAGVGVESGRAGMAHDDPCCPRRSHGPRSGAEARCRSRWSARVHAFVAKRGPSFGRGGGRRRRLGGSGGVDDRGRGLLPRARPPGRGRRLQAPANATRRPTSPPGGPASVSPGASRTSSHSSSRAAPTGRSPTGSTSRSGPSRSTSSRCCARPARSTRTQLARVTTPT